MRINVGCGSTPTVGDGWRNFDNSPSLKLARQPLRRTLMRALGLLDAENLKYIAFCRANRIEYADCRRMPLPANSVEVAYSCHMMEHLDREDAAAYLRESLRVLQPGGILRVAVPDLKLSAKRYMEDGDLERFMDHLHLVAPAGKRLGAKLRYLWLGHRHHQWMYDAAHLTRLMLECGLVEPVVLAAGQTTIPNAGALDLFERSADSLYVEARKPAAK